MSRATSRDANRATRGVLSLFVGLFVVIAAGSAHANPWAEGEVLGPDGCPIRLLVRTPAQVMAEHTALLAAGEVAAAMCDYAENAVVIMPGQVLEGRALISMGFTQFYALLGGTVPTITTLTIHDEVAFETFYVDTPVVSIPDGADTFIIRQGHIQTQTVHSSLVFHQPPPQ